MAEGLKNIFRLMTPTVWDIRSDVTLDREQSYLVVSNHQSWVDIPALVEVFNRRAPFFKFFLKKELIWVPVIGIAWWGLDFPFMKRHSPQYLLKHPEKRGQDLATTRRACEKFRYTPVSVMNFVEGTRATPDKIRQQKSSYRHLLTPKAGGVGFVLDAMGDAMETLVDVTIAYPGGAPSFWDFLCGRVSEIRMEIHTRPIPPQLKGRDYAKDAEYRRMMKDWLTDLWQQKDERLERMLTEGDH